MWSLCLARQSRPRSAAAAIKLQQCCRRRRRSVRRMVEEALPTESFHPDHQTFSVLVISLSHLGVERCGHRQPERIGTVTFLEAEIFGFMEIYAQLKILNSIF